MAQRFHGVLSIPSPHQACAHACYDELRDPENRLPNGDALPPLFDFTAAELRMDAQLNPILIPEHARTATNWPPEAVIANAARSSSSSSSSSSSRHASSGKGRSSGNGGGGGGGGGGGTMSSSSHDVKQSKK